MLSQGPFHTRVSLSLHRRGLPLKSSLDKILVLDKANNEFLLGFAVNISIVWILAVCNGIRVGLFLPYSNFSHYYMAFLEIKSVCEP